MTIHNTIYTLGRKLKLRIIALNVLGVSYIPQAGLYC